MLNNKCGADVGKKVINLSFYMYEPTPKSVCIKNAFHFVTNRGADVANMTIGNDVLLDMVSYSDKVKAP